MVPVASARRVCFHSRRLFKLTYLLYGARAVGVGAPLIEWRVHVFGDGRVKTKAGAAGAGNWPLMSRISAEVTVEC